MSEASIALRRMAAWVATNGTSDESPPAELAEVFERVSQQLDQRLATWFGPGMTVPLLRRAALMGGREYPFLAEVEFVSQGRVQMKGLPESLRGHDLRIVRAGLVALLANVFGLLSDFIGEDLVILSVREAWPEMPEAQADHVLEGDQG